VVGFSCVAFNVPRFFRNTIETCPLRDDPSAVGREVVKTLFRIRLKTC